MKLYTTRTTPFGRTVEIVMRELGLDEDIEQVPTAVAPTKPNREFEAVNPLRRIPALVTEDGEVLVDSAVITAYLAARVGDTALFAEGSPERWRIASRYAVARGATECAVACRYETAVRPEDKRWHDWSSDLEDKVMTALTMFEADPPIPTGRLTIADVSLGALLGYLDFRYAHLGWRERFPALVRFMTALEERPSFKATVPA
jgi:glutathione S-transferase